MSRALDAESHNDDVDGDGQLLSIYAEMLSSNMQGL